MLNRSNVNTFLVGGLSSYLMPVAALGAMGYCYMWWKVRLGIQILLQLNIYVLDTVLSDACLYKHIVMTCLTTPFLAVLFVILQGWSLSDVMFVTKHNMSNAVATVSKQLEHVSETLAVSC